jgi:hypothetical protein
MVRISAARAQARASAFDAAVGGFVDSEGPSRAGDGTF